jgi:hypothetical protein
MAAPTTLPGDPIMSASKGAMAEAGLYEAKCRMIAEVIPELRQHASKGLDELDPIVRNALNR